MTERDKMNGILEDLDLDISDPFVANPVREFNAGPLVTGVPIPTPTPAP